MKKVVKCLLLFTLCSLLLFSSTAFADSLNIEKVTSNVYGLLFKIGVILAVCLTATLAISYMVATPNKKAMLKERLIYYFAGVIFLVGGLAFLNIYEGVSDDIGDTVYTDGAPSKIKDYFQNQITTTSSTSSKAEEAMEIDDETLDDMAEDVISNGSDNVSSEDLAILLYRLSSIKDEYADSIEFDKLYNHFDELTDDQKEIVWVQARLALNSSPEDRVQAERDLIDFHNYYYQEDKNTDIFRWTIEQWKKDTTAQKDHRWYYENIVLNNYENLWK